ncbi:MAG: arylsulfatase [Phycisphaeraceae bacterium]
MKANLFCALIVVLLGLAEFPPAHADSNNPPNIIYIYADDLGYGELGSYGQSKIKTPHLDNLASNGTRFTRHYSGAPVCAPSRAVLMTGIDTGRNYIRDNSPWYRKTNPHQQGQEPLKPEYTTVAELLKEQGYRTAVAGKWGLGGPESYGIPNKHGFDDFFGYHCQWVAHSYYPDHLWHNEKKIPFNDEPVSGYIKPKPPVKDWSVIEADQYAPDWIADKMLNWLDDAANRDEPFFFWYASIIPHVALHIPQEYIQRYGYERMDDKPYHGNRGYSSHPTPRLAYAAMISYLDEQVGKIIKLLEEKGELDNTLIIFSSDNGASYAGGADAKYFQSVGGLRGLKGSVFEGGIRVPMIAAWPGKIRPGTTSDLVCGQVDILPTLIEAAGGKAPRGIDGVSFLPTLTGNGEQVKPDFYYWELGNKQAILQNDWKLVRTFNKQDRPTTYLFNLEEDPYEKNNLADRHPARVKRLIDLIIAHRTEAEVKGFRFPAFSSDTTRSD